MRLSHKIAFPIFFSLIFCQIPKESEYVESFYMQQPYDKAVLFAKNQISYPFMNHSSVTISKDLDEIYWSKWYDVEGREEIVYSRKNNGIWSAPKPVSFSGVYSDDVPFLSPNNNRLYFLSRRPINNSSTKENIWYVERIDSLEWSEPMPISKIINSQQMHWQFSVAGNENIYFSTDEGIKLSEYVDGEYQSPVLITKTMNQNYIGGHPYIAPDESYIIFASRELPDSYGKYDIYIGFKNSQDVWSDPINIGESINGLKNELCPIISPNKQFIFFVKQEDVYNIFWSKADFLINLNPYVDK